MTRSITRVTTAALLVWAVAGCADAGSNSGSDPGGDAGAGGSVTMSTLDGRTFLSTGVAQSGDPYPLVKGSQISLGFADDRISASAGCNTMGSGATIDGDVLTIDGHGLMTTEMGCDPALMDQDTWLAGVLTAGPTVTLDGDNLTLTSGDTVIDLQDKETAQPDASLTGTPWTLDSIGSGSGDGADGAVSSVPSGVDSTLLIDSDGAVSVRPGCNTGRGQVEIGDTTLTFGPMATTRMMCDHAAMSVETTVLQVLDGRVSYRIDSDLLTISDDATTLTYRAGAGTSSG